MSRSQWKGVYKNESLLTEFEKKDFYYNRVFIIKTTSRSSIVLKKFIGYIFEIHTGKAYFKTTITPDMIGFKLGELAFTRIHSLPKKKGKRKIIIKKKNGTKS
jgi:ribosomal protein S19